MGTNSIGRQASSVKVRTVELRGVSIEVGGAYCWMSWDDLCAAASQSDREGAAAYGPLYERAAEMARAQSPIIVSYGQDSTGVWWTTGVRTEWGGFGFPRRYNGVTVRAADEGGSLPHAGLAKQEAEDRARRIREALPSRTIRVQTGH